LRGIKAPIWRNLQLALCLETHLAEVSRQSRIAPTLVGLVLTLVGAVALGVLFYISNSRDPAAERAMIGLGLAGSVLVSAVAQAMVVVGLWMLWRVTRRKPG
jgi:hypothetical protein